MSAPSVGPKSVENDMKTHYRIRTGGRAAKYSALESLQELKSSTYDDESEYEEEDVSDYEESSSSEEDDRRKRKRASGKSKPIPEDIPEDEDGMSLETRRRLNVQRNAQLFASFGIDESHKAIKELKNRHKETKQKRQKEEPALPERKSQRLENMPRLPNLKELDSEEMSMVEETFEEDQRKPPGTFDIATSLRYAGSGASREKYLKSWFPTEMEVFGDSAQPRTDLSDFVSKMQSLKITPKSHVNVMKAKRYFQCSSLTFHPMTDKALLIMGDGAGNLGFWNILESKNRIRMQPHSQGITEIGVHQQNPNVVITSSSDGTVRATDMSAMQVLEPYRSPSFMPILTFDFVTPDVVIKGQSNSKASVLDLRESTIRATTSFTCSDGKTSLVKGITVHPVHSDMFVTATYDGSVLLWDLRNPMRCVKKLENVKNVQFCRYSPCTGSRLMTASWKSSNPINEVRIYNIRSVKKGTMHPRHVIRSKMETSFFRPTWVPNRQDCFFIGTQAFPREVAMFNTTARTRVASICDDLLVSMCHYVVFHPTQNCLVGANNGGHAYAFVP